MPVLGIITCEILELEIAHLLSADPDLAEVTVLEDDSSSGFIEALEELGRFNPQRTPMLRGFRPLASGKFEVLVRVLELALHNRKWLLQEGLVKASKEMSRYVDAILLGYGLCGNALQNPEELLAETNVPIILPMDTDHPVDDCVGLIIGGREGYYEEQCKEAGTFFMIPGWTRHWKRLIDKDFGKMDMKMAKRIFSNYKRSLLIPTSVSTEEAMKHKIDEFNRLFGLRVEMRPGTLEILQKAWDEAKTRVCE